VKTSAITRALAFAQIIIAGAIYGSLAIGCSSTEPTAVRSNEDAIDPMVIQGAPTLSAALVVDPTPTPTAASGRVRAFVIERRTGCQRRLATSVWNRRRHLFQPSGHQAGWRDNAILDGTTRTALSIGSGRDGHFARRHDGLRTVRRDADAQIVVAWRHALSLECREVDLAGHGGRGAGLRRQLHR